jgi:hypothetical protein
MKLAILLLLLTAPAVHATQVVAAPGPRNSTLVTSAEILDSDRHNVYDFVRAHRPLWLRTRGGSGMGRASVMVYLDGHLLGPATEMRGIPTAIVSQLRYLDRREATTRYGLNHGNGAIMVITGLPAATPLSGAS